MKRIRSQPRCDNCGDETTESIHAGVYVCTSCERCAELDDSTHITDDRWIDRSDDPDESVLGAWKDGIQMNVRGRDEHRLFGDEIRYHHGTTTILIRKDDTLTTSIDFRTARSGIQGSVVKALVENDAENRVIAEAMRIAGIDKEQFRALVRTIGADSSTITAGGGKTAADLREQ